MKELAHELKDFLAKSEEIRMAGFRAIMKDIIAGIEAIRRSVRHLLADYKAERKEAAGHWADLQKRGSTVAEGEVKVEAEEHHKHHKKEHHKHGKK